MLNARLLSLVLACSFLFGGPTGCVTLAMIEGVVEEGDPGAGEVAARVGVAGLLLPLTLSADFVIAVTLGWLIYDDDDDDDDCDEDGDEDEDEGLPEDPAACARR